jgi:hypothetical protein
MLLAAIVATGLLVIISPDEITMANFPSNTGWTSSAIVSQSVTRRGENLIVTINVKSAARRNVLVDLEIHDASGKVFQKVWSNQQFRSGQTRSYSTVWTVPEAASDGEHIVKIGVFGNRWRSFKSWNDHAAVFLVKATDPVPPTTAPPTTAPPSTVAPTTTPATTIAPTTPPTTVAPTTVPPTTAPATTAPPTTVPPTTVPATTVPATTVPPSVPPSTAVPATPPGGVKFFEDFRSADGFYSRFQTEVLHGTGQIPTDITMWHGDHNGACEGPTTSRDVHVNNPAESFWFCAPKGPDSGHVMTSMYTSGYAQVDFSPNQSFTDINRVCWDQNLTEMGGRKWTQLVVVPEATYKANGYRLSYVTPVLQDQVAVAGIALSGDTFLLEMLRGSTQTFVGQTVSDVNFAGFTTSDKAARYKQCVTDLENGTVKVEMFGRPGGTDTRILRGSLPNGAVRVIFQDDNYNPPKDELSTDSLTTWHWDNIEIS